jgi:hypothetical protein
MKNKNGFAAMSAVLIISGVILAIITTVTIMAVGEGQSALSVELGNTDQYLVDGCVEDVLQKIHDLATYNITTITRPEGTCTVVYNTAGPVNWDITVDEAGNNYGKIVRVVFIRGTTNTITSWKEI